jgi:hypothetical protein
MEQQRIVWGMDHLQDDNDDVCIKKKGFLSKESKLIKSWRRRWFILKSDCLCAFKSDDVLNQKPTEQISLSACSSVRALVGTGKDYILEVETPARTFLLGASSEFERDAWVEAIQDCCLSLFVDDGCRRRLSRFPITEGVYEDESDCGDIDPEEISLSNNCEIDKAKLREDNQHEELLVSCTTPMAISLCLDLLADALF